MKDLRFISWNFAHIGGSKVARAMLERCDLRHLAHQEMDFEVEQIVDGEHYHWKRSSWGCVRLPVDDPRLPVLMRELRSFGMELHPRTDRVYTQRERDNAPWLHAPGGTVMVQTGGPRQQWNKDDACPICGSGSKAIPPLVAVLGRMPKSGFALSSPYGHVIVSNKLGDALTDKKLTGFELRSIRKSTRPEIDDRFKWLEIVSIWPRWSPATVTNPADICEACWRAGHLGLWDAVTDLHYDTVPLDACDFNITWEQFGYWSVRDRDDQPDARVGSAPRLIISQRARQILKSEGVRLQVEPVFIAGELAL